MSLREHLAGRGILLGDEVGHGATAVVYRAEDRRHGRTVAVKVFTPGSGGELAEDRFLREIQLAAGLQHPHILPVYDSGAADGALFYVMPYVEGESLRAAARPRGPTPGARGAPDRARGGGRARLRARPWRGAPRHQAREHPAGRRPRGRRPTSASRWRSRPAGDDGRLTIGGLVVGSPAYMSPEQASGDPAVDGRSDIYSLGCVVYEMLAGEPPFSGMSPRADRRRRFLGPPVPLSGRRSDVPAEVSAAVQKALALDPAERFARVEEFAAALGASLAAAPRQVPFPRSRGGRGYPRLRRSDAAAGPAGRQGRRSDSIRGVWPWPR